MWREAFYVILVSLCFALHICCASSVSSDEVLQPPAEAPSPPVRASTVYPVYTRPPASQNVTLIFVAGVSICLAIFVVSYCIAYRFIMLRQGEMNRLYRSRLRGMNILEEQNPYGAAAWELEPGVHGGLDASLVSSLRSVQYRSAMASGRFKEEVVKAGPPLLQEQNVIMWVKECAVCLSEYEEGEEMKVLPVCGHCFHKACINMWLFSHTTCPICRLSLLNKLPAADSAIAAPSHPPPRGFHVAVDI